MSIISDNVCLHHTSFSCLVTQHQHLLVLLLRPGIVCVMRSLDRCNLPPPTYQTREMPGEGEDRVRLGRMGEWVRLNEDYHLGREGGGGWVKEVKGGV